MFYIFFITAAISIILIWSCKSIYKLEYFVISSIKTSYKKILRENKNLWFFTFQSKLCVQITEI